MKTFTAITIGPIYDTFSQARRTRAIWAASYFFSLFMRKIIEKTKEENWEIMLPYNKEIFKGKHGAGLYADRLYFINKTKDDLTNIVNETIKFFAEDFEKQELSKMVSKVYAETFLKNYLNLRIVEISLTDEQINEIKNEKDEKGKSCNSVLEILNDLLDNQELTKNYVFDLENNYINDYFTVKWNANTELKIDAFGNDKERYFKSIGEIATNDLQLKNKYVYEKLLRENFKNEDIQLIDKLKKEFKLQDYHKYYAVLYADGDNIGDLLKSVANDYAKLQTFSEKLLDFGLKAEETIMKNGGNAIYLGGEDIFAFLPIAFNQNNQLLTLAHLIDNLDKDFDKTLGEYARLQKVTVPSLSYGLMLTYYKFPMREAMQQSHELLEHCKKEFKDSGKNAIGVRFQKHSGQYMECFIEKNKKQSTKLIYELLTQHIQIKDKKDTLSGLIQRLKDDVFFTTFMLALRKNRIDAFFKNFFNEDIHTAKADFIDCFAELVKVLHSDYCILTDENDIKKEDDNLKKILFTVLRYYQFIQPKKNRKDE